MSAAQELVVSCGDPQGIGPEIAVAAAQRFAAAHPESSLVLVGDADQLRRLGVSSALKDAQASAPRGVSMLGVTAASCTEAPPSLAGGRTALASLEVAFARVRHCGGALVTAPLSKQAVALSAPGFTGHTEWLGAQCGCETLMLFATPRLKLALATVHVPLARVPDAVRAGAVDRALKLLRDGLMHEYGIREPRVAVLALNPHAGEGGMLGSEEREVITPCVQRWRERGFAVSGPFSADGFFGARGFEQYDATLALYHDQGLVAVKSLGFGEAVNVTLGLPLVRTSVDHGCAFDLAGRGLAQSGSMIAALEEAGNLLRLRRRD